MSTYDGNLVCDFNFMLLLQCGTFEFVGHCSHGLFISTVLSWIVITLHFNPDYCRVILVKLELKFDNNSPINEGSQTVDLKVQHTIPYKALILVKLVNYY